MNWSPGNFKNRWSSQSHCCKLKRNKGHQIFLSRAHPQFLAKLFFLEVPEIYEGTIEIKSVARDPGSDENLCSFTRLFNWSRGSLRWYAGSRVQTIVNELHGEKTVWLNDWRFANFNLRVLSPAEIQRVLIDQENKIDIILTEKFK